MSALGVPRLAAIAIVASVAFPLAELNSKVARDGKLIAPEIIGVENLAPIVLIVTVPMLVVALRRAWRLLPAATTTKRRHVVRAALLQLGAVALAALGIVATRPPTPRIVASAESADGRRAWAFESEWGCGYRVGVEDRFSTVAIVGTVGPFECKAPPPRLEWRGRDIRLLSADGRFDATWPGHP